MRWITPHQIACELFTSRWWFRRGYDETEVDQFLDWVAEDVELMQQHIGDLEAEVAELHAMLDGRQQPESEAGPMWEPGVFVQKLDLSSPSFGGLTPAPYPALAPERLDALNGGQPTPDVPRPAPDGFRDGTGHMPRPGAPARRGAMPEAGNVSDPGPGYSLDVPLPDAQGHPITDWRIWPMPVPSIADDAEAFLATIGQEPEVWRTGVDAERAVWCARVGLDFEPIAWAEP